MKAALFKRRPDRFEQQPAESSETATADAALFEALEATVETTENRRVERLPCHINDPAFAEAAAAAYRAISRS